MRIPTQMSGPRLLGSPVIMRSKALSSHGYGRDHRLMVMARDTAAELKDYKRNAFRVLTEYFFTGQFERAKIVLLEQTPLFGHDLVKRLIISSFDDKTMELARERGASAVLFLQKALKCCLLTDEDVQLGLALALGRIEDVAIDVPFAPKLLEVGLGAIEVCRSVMSKVLEVGRGHRGAVRC